MENITASDFSKFKVSDDAAVCASCRQNGNAPVVIKGQRFCLWCSLEHARTLLRPRIVA